MSYYRVQSPTRNPQDLLNPDHQTSTSYANDTTRPGVSVCESLEDLAHYLAFTGIMQNDWVVIELDGTEADERDEDHNLGAILVHPTEIISVAPMSAQLDDMIHEIFEADEVGINFAA